MLERIGPEFQCLYKKDQNSNDYKDKGELKCLYK